MASQVDIYNMALGNIGQTDTVASLDERSKARLICSRFWDFARDTVLADFPWQFATKYQGLARLAGSLKNWQYQYQYPNDCLRALYLTTPGSISPAQILRPMFQVAYGETGQIIVTNDPDAELVYVVRVTDPGRFPPMFVEALSWKLAALIAMPLTNTRTIAETASQFYTQSAQAAWSQSLNEAQGDTMFTSEFVTVRGQ